MDPKELFSLDMSGATSAKKKKRTADTIALPSLDAPVQGKKLPIEEDFEVEQKEMRDIMDEEPNRPSWMVQARERDTNRVQRAINADYIVVLVFNDYSDATRFLNELQEPVYLAQYVDGYKVAQRLGLSGAPSAPLNEPQVNVLDQWDDMALAVTPPPEEEPDPVLPAKAATPGKAAARRKGK